MPRTEKSKPRKPGRDDNGQDLEKSMRIAKKHLKINTIPVYIRKGLTIYVDHLDKVDKVKARYAGK